MTPDSINFMGYVLLAVVLLLVAIGFFRNSEAIKKLEERVKKLEER